MIIKKKSPNHLRGERAAVTLKSSRHLFLPPSRLYLATFVSPFYQIRATKHHLLVSCHCLVTVTPPSCHHLATFSPPSCHNLSIFLPSMSSSCNHVSSFSSSMPSCCHLVTILPPFCHHFPTLSPSVLPSCHHLSTLSPFCHHFVTFYVTFLPPCFLFLATFLSPSVPSSCHPPPRTEAWNVWCLPPVWNLRTVIWFHVTISVLVLLPSPVTLSALCFFLPAGPFSWLFFQKIPQHFSLRDRLYCMASVKQLWEINWSVVYAAWCPMALVFA